MAVYAAYRHIELDNVGYGKKRVLKPPGGGSSDIFGASEPAQNPSRRAPRPQMQSTLFGPSQDAAASPRSKPDGNPVTGEGYAAAVNGEKDSSAPAPAPAPNNPAPVTNGTAHSAPPQRARVPPGGFSSGLW